MCVCVCVKTYNHMHTYMYIHVLKNAYTAWAAQPPLGRHLLLLHLLDVQHLLLAAACASVQFAPVSYTHPKGMEAYVWPLSTMLQ